MQEWSHTSWQHFSYLQSAHYADHEQLNKVVDQLAQLPPLSRSIGSASSFGYQWRGKSLKE